MTRRRTAVVFAWLAAAGIAQEAPAPAPDDAAPAYRRIVSALRARFGPDVVLPDHDVPTDDDAPPGDLETLVLTRTDWRTAVAAAEPELAAWREAARLPKCRFARTSAEPMMTEFMQDLFLPLQRLRQLGLAAGLQAIADAEPARVERALASALGLARQLRGEPGGIAWGVACGIETDAATLCERAAPLGAELAARLRQQCTAHLADRPGAGAVVVALRLELEHLFAATLVQLQLGKDAQASVARRFGVQVRAAFVQRVQPIFAAAEALPDEPEAPPAARRAAFDRAVADLLAAKQERMAALKALQAAGEPGAEAAADLGLLLATLLQPPLPSLLDEHCAARERLRAAAR